MLQNLKREFSDIVATYIEMLTILVIIMVITELSRRIMIYYIHLNQHQKQKL